MITSGEDVCSFISIFFIEYLRISSLQLSSLWSFKSSGTFDADGNEAQTTALDLIAFQKVLQTRNCHIWKYDISTSKILNVVIYRCQDFPPLYGWGLWIFQTLCLKYIFTRQNIRFPSLENTFYIVMQIFHTHFVVLQAV